MSPRRQPERRLPPDTDHLRGLRAARWTRESTGKVDADTGKPAGGQWDAFGPDAQRSHQDRAIERLGLVDVAEIDPSLDFRVAHSGRTVGATKEFRAMLSRAGTDFDVLVVGYISRFTRDLRTAVNALHEMHSRGAVIYFADEHVLTSDERRWKEWADEAVEAEAYSRKLGRRVSEGLEAKRLRLGEPGGRPPYGFTRDGSPPVLVEDPERMAVLRSVFEMAAQGLTDREVAERTGLKKSHISELLTNRIYVGELDGGGRRAAVIDREVWERVRASRVRHARRHPGPISYRRYLLSGLLRCRACGRRLIGHSGRYRHTEGCDACREARAIADWERRGKGDSFKTEVYDHVISDALARVSANAEMVASIAEAVESLPAPMNELALQRIRCERREVNERLQESRDTASWLAGMERLDTEEAEVRASSAPGPTRREIAAHLADLQRLFGQADTSTQQRIAKALFEQVEVLGPTQVWLHPSEEAVAQGWATAMSDEFTAKVSQSGRGERSRADTSQQFLLRFSLADPHLADRVAVGS